MAEPTETVRDALVDESFAQRVSAAVRDKLSALAGAVSDSVLKAAADRAVEAAAKHLDTPLADLLTAAWERYPEIQELCDARLHPADEETLAELVEHRFAWSYAPKLEVAVGALPAVQVPLALELGITVKAGVLVVQGGRFRELRGGKVAADASFAVAGQDVAKQEKEIALPRVLRFGGGEGVPIRRDAVPAVKLVAARDGQPARA